MPNDTNIWNRQPHCLQCTFRRLEYKQYRSKWKHDFNWIQEKKNTHTHTVEQTRIYLWNIGNIKTLISIFGSLNIQSSNSSFDVETCNTYILCTCTKYNCFLFHNKKQKKNKINFWWKTLCWASSFCFFT